MTGTPATADTFPKLLLHHAERRGAMPALRHKHRGIWRTLTWSGYADETLALAAALAARGLKRGSHMAFIGDNRPRLYALMCAAQALGAVIVPLFADAAADELAAPLQLAGVSHAFGEDQEQADKLLALLPACPALKCIVYDADRGMRHYRQPELVSGAALLEQGRHLLPGQRAAVLAELSQGRGSDAAGLYFTSGATGAAKGVVLTHGALIDRAQAIATADGLSAADIALAYLPPAWIAQHLFGYALPLAVGCTVCCPESSDTLVSDMREAGPTVLLATPRMLETLRTQVYIRIEGTGRLVRKLYAWSMRLADRAGARILDGAAVPLADRLACAAADLLVHGPLRDVFGLARVRVAYSTGEAIGSDLLLYYRSMGINLKQLYGSAETGGLVALQRDGQVAADSVGHPAPGVELSFGPRQEVLVRSPGLFKQYLAAGDAPLPAAADGWFDTGDVGYLGADGHLRIVDRAQDIGALADGTVHHPRLLESRLKASPFVREAVTFGDRREAVCALIDIEAATVGHWADQRSLSYTGHAELASHPEVQRLVADAVAAVNARLSADAGRAGAQIRRFLILQEGLDADDGVLTRTSKLRRGAILARYGHLVDAMYAGQARVAPTAGAAQGAEAEAPQIAILDARTYPHAGLPHPGLQSA
jgi:long-chain acyl-CoA synthetase